MEKRVAVLDKGYVRLIDWMGSDLSVVNAARASYAKESDELKPADVRLISFLAKNGHTSPFRHAFVTFEFKAPLMVARQHWKYVVGSDHTMDSWNESSRRYVTQEPQFYIIGIEDWRQAPDNNKQGSGGPLGKFEGALLTNELIGIVEKGEQLYKWAMNEMNVCPEQARAFLPAYNMYLNYRWSASLQSICHFLIQRLEEGAQSEIAQYAKAVYRIAQPLFPVTIKEWVGAMEDYHWGGA